MSTQTAIVYCGDCAHFERRGKVSVCRRFVERDPQEKTSVHPVVELDTPGCHKWEASPWEEF